MKVLGFSVEFIGAQRVNPNSQYELETAIDVFTRSIPHILLTFIPGSPSEEENENGLYHRFKSASLGQDLQSQVIYESTLGNSFALENIVLGILAKTGNVPYVLAESLPYTDIVVGIDIARERAKRRQGSINVAAITRVYAANGDFLHYKLHDAPLEGETLPKPVLRQLLPSKVFAGKRTIIQRDGLFRGYEREDLMEWAKEIGAQFHLVEIVKSDIPRLYMTDKGIIQKPPKGTIFRLSEREAFVVTSLAHKRSTPRPLLIRTDGTITIEHAIHAVLSLTMLHYGSTLPPRLPVTIHYSDKIGYLALRGIKPKASEGTVPFWL